MSRATPLPSRPWGLGRAAHRRIRALLTLAVLLGTLGVASFYWLKPTIPSLTTPSSVSPQLPVPSADASEVAAADLATLPAYRDAIPVLMYHSVSDNSSEYTVTPQQFADQMEMLARGGFHTVTIAQVTNFLKGTVALPARPILLTFDDGIQTDWTTVDPILKQHDFHAVAFIITGHVAANTDGYYLTWDELRALQASGRWDIEAHTDNLHYLTRVVGGGTGAALLNRIILPGGGNETFEQWQARVTADLARNVAVLEHELGRTPTAFAYPFSAATSTTNDPRIPAAAKAIVDADFQLSFAGYVTGRTAITSRSSSSEIPRITIESSMTAAVLLQQIEAALSVPHDLSNLDWRADGGSCVAGDGKISLSSGRFVTCTPVVNTTGWKDYQFDATVSGQDRKASAIVAFRSSDAGRVEVVVGESTLKVRQAIRGAWTSLVDAPLPKAPATDGSRQLRISVAGSQATVSIDGGKPYTVPIGADLQAGGVQFGLAAQQGERTISFLNPTLTALDLHRGGGFAVAADQ